MPSGRVARGRRGGRSRRPAREGGGGMVARPSRRPRAGRRRVPVVTQPTIGRRGLRVHRRVPLSVMDRRTSTLRLRACSSSASKPKSIPTPDDALPGRQTRSSSPASTPSSARRSPARGRRAPETASSASAASGAPRRTSGSCPASSAPRSAMPAATRPNPTYRGGLHRPDRPRRGRPGRVSTREGLVRAAAQALLGAPRPDPGHAPGQRRRHPVPLDHHRRRRRAAAAAEASRDCTRSA